MTYILLSFRFLSSNQFKYYKRSSVSGIQCALLNTMDVYAERATLHSPLFSEGASRITWDIAVLYIFKGYCWRGARHSAGSYERKGRKWWTPRKRTLHYVCTRGCACRRVRFLSVFETGEGNRETERTCAKKNLSPDAVRRTRNSHNALFTLAPRAKACKLFTRELLSTQ